jgi:hypothetical protein
MLTVGYFLSKTTNSRKTYPPRRGGVYIWVIQMFI